MGEVVIQSLIRSATPFPEEVVSAGASQGKANALAASPALPAKTRVRPRPARASVARRVRRRRQTGGDHATLLEKRQRSRSASELMPDGGKMAHDPMPVGSPPRPATRAQIGVEVHERMKTYALVFVSVLLAELGDKTQLATLLFASDPTVNRVGVFAASAAALVTARPPAVG